MQRIRWLPFFIRNSVAFALIAEWTRNNYIVGPISSSARQRIIMVGVICGHWLATPITKTALTFILRKYVILRIFTRRIQFARSSVFAVLSPFLSVSGVISPSRPFANFGMLLCVSLDGRKKTHAMLTVKLFPCSLEFFLISFFVNLRFLASTYLALIANAARRLVVLKKHIVGGHFSAIYAHSEPRQWDGNSDAIFFAFSLFPCFSVGARMTNITNPRGLGSIFDEFCKRFLFTASSTNACRNGVHSDLTFARSHEVGSQGGVSAAFSLIGLDY